ncbi:MAG TPA: biopolymer transporter ExbB, partial [Janthinobacterium sp.]|nr:biopolymer transporter ExbB [Janthinobacterium sp.]
MFKNIRPSAGLTVTALLLCAVTLFATPAFADAPAPAAAAVSAAAATAISDAADAADAKVPPAAAKEEVANPFGIQAVWAGGFVPRATL